LLSEISRGGGDRTSNLFADQPAVRPPRHADHYFLDFCRASDRGPPGIFPTAGASNPTYTIFALSLRGAEQLAAEWSTVAG
jgi:hypothetical protein